MKPITNQDGGASAMGAASIPEPQKAEHSVSGPTDRGMGSEIGMSNWRAKNGSTVSTVAPLVDGPND